MEEYEKKMEEYKTELQDWKSWKKTQVCFNNLISQKNKIITKCVKNLSSNTEKNSRRLCIHFIMFRYILST